MELSTHLKSEKPAPVGKPDAGYQNELSTAILASGERSVLDLMADPASINEEIYEHKRFFNLQARSALAGLELTESSTGFNLVGHRVRRHCGDLASVARALGEIGEVPHE